MTDSGENVGVTVVRVPPPPQRGDFLNNKILHDEQTSAAW